MKSILRLRQNQKKMRMMTISTVTTPITLLSIIQTNNPTAEVHRKSFVTTMRMISIMIILSNKTSRRSITATWEDRGGRIEKWMMRMSINMRSMIELFLSLLTLKYHFPRMNRNSSRNFYPRHLFYRLNRAIIRSFSSSRSLKVMKIVVRRS